MPELEELGGFPTDVNSPASRIIVFKSAILLNKMNAQSVLTVWRKNNGENKTHDSRIIKCEKS